MTTTPELISHGLNLQLVLKDAQQMPQLMMAIASKRDATFASLQELHFVHFARFLPSHDNTALQVITSFDGPLDAYALDFVIAIGDIFDAILSFVADAPPLPVREYPQAFFEFVKRNNRVTVAPPALVWDDYPVYSAYPERTVIEILGPRKNPPPVRAVAPSTVELADVQGNILTGYRAKCARHYSLRLQSGPLARTFIGKLVVDAGTDDSLPKITSAQPWHHRPNYMLNIGFSASGLRALGVPTAQFAAFSKAFLQGAGYADRAEANGDTGASSPEFWEIGGARTEVHIMLSLFAQSGVSSEEYEARHAQLMKAFAIYQLELIHLHEADAMPHGKVHFGYEDGIAQPRLAGIDKVKKGGAPDPDLQPLAAVGEFLLGSNYTSVYGGTSLGQLPAALCQNATFAAVRVLDQDVAAFEAMLDETANTYWVDREWVAAKLMGRYRDGRPLVPPPQSNAANPAGCPVAHGKNAFDYAPSLAHPDLPNDSQGIQCPVGSHIRRMNPRSSLVAGQPYSRRLIRRGMPYGPAWSKEDPDARRGLFGIFICGDLERQFEFLMQQWANGDFSASGIRGTQDPIIGAQSISGTFKIPMPAGQVDIEVKTPRWTTTRGSVYLLMPGLAGLRWLAKGEGFDDSAASIMGPAQWLSEPPAVQTKSRLAPSMFDPMDPDFLDNPYPYYAAFRKNSPVALVQRGSYKSYWVFSHELCQQAALDPSTFLKQTTTTPLAGRGLFFMDDPQHAQARSALDPEFMQAISHIDQSTQTKSQQALQGAEALLSKQSFDLVGAYANPVLRNVFMDMFGWPASQWETLGNLVEVMLQAFNPMLPNDQRLPSYAAAGQIIQMLEAGVSRCPAHAASAGTALGLFCRVQGLAGTPALSPEEATQSAFNFLLGGYLSCVFLVSTGVNNLLNQPTALAAYQNGDAALRGNAFQEMQRFDAPFQLADRFAAEDMTFGGVLIPKNSLISLVYGSANHDEAIFGKTSEQFDISRSIDPMQNFVFGTGEHSCIGAPMAKRIVPIVMDTLLDQYANLSRVAGASQKRDDPYFRGFSSLMLKLA